MEDYKVTQVEEVDYTSRDCGRLQDYTSRNCGRLQDYTSRLHNKGLWKITCVLKITQVEKVDMECKSLLM